MCKANEKSWFFEAIGITDFIEASEVIMAYVVFEVTESLTSHLDTYFSNLVMNTIYFSSLKKEKNIGQNNRFSS